ncbi:MAG: GTPase, partial [Bacilli bacterium]
KGEFSAQSYYNGKMDLLKAEGINDLINATSKRAKTIATETLSGKNSAIVLDLKKKLLDYLSELEYYVEDQYSQEKDDYDEELLKVKKSLDKDILDLDKIIDKTKRANREYQGFNIAIAGEPNVGKSTLLNAILGEDKAIVSPIPGTTRDVVEGEKEINGLLFRFKDTAGLRKTSDFVENLGIERSYKTVKDADLVLLTSDCGFEDIYKDEELKSVLKDKKIIKVATKRDINTHIADADISICSLKDDISALTDKILSALSLDKKEESAFLGKREEEYLEKISSQMKKASEAISETGQIDISSDTLRVAVAFINELIGNSEGQTMEDIYQTLFSKFCLGK